MDTVKQSEKISGTLYVLGTPIGNLGDISTRALEILNSVDFIAAEDTRVSVKLLTHFNIKKPLISCHEHNIIQKSAIITERLLNGESCAIITDAGMPCISDPGEELVKLAAERGINIEVVPGPSAFVAALAVSGLPTSRFSFEGFLPIAKKQRSRHLDEIKNFPHTLIFYEAPHKLKNSLENLLAAFGDRNIALCRELTKIHEEVVRGKISDMIRLYEEKQPRGEYVLVIEGNKNDKNENNNIYTQEGAAKIAENLVHQGMKQSEACKQAAEITGFKKSDIYKLLLK